MGVRQASISEFDAACEWPCPDQLVRLSVLSGSTMAKIGYWLVALLVVALGGVAVSVWPSLQREAPPVKEANAPAKAVVTAAGQPSPKVELVVEIFPEFDIVRVEPTGELVIAGRAAPSALIVLMRSDQQHDSASADASGHFAMAPKPLPVGQHELRLIATDKVSQKASKQSVFVSVPADKKGEVIVALQQPGAPTVQLNTQPPPQQGERARVHIFSVDVLSTGQVSASGTAQPGADIRLYLNDSFIVAAKAASNGAWSLTIEKGVTPGLYRLRADDAAPDGKIFSRAEVQFEVPAIQANATPNTQLASASPGSVVVGQVSTATVSKGDSLWRISEKIYGVGTRYTVIHGANSAQIRDPNLIYPGQVFVVPAKSP